MQVNGLHSNIWKYVIVQFTSRRNFIPILSVYYLTLPNATANDIGLYAGTGYIASMLMQIPSGYLADNWGQKNTLIVAKIFLLMSSILFLIAGDFWIFTLGAICMSLGSDAFSNGTTASFLKGTLEKLNRGDEYRNLASRISGNIALFSVIFIVLLPFLTQFDIRIPLYIGLVIDIVGLLFAFSLYPVHTAIKPHDSKGFLVLAKEIYGTGFYPYAIFTATISAFLLVDTVYRSPYLIELGYPLIYIGLVMGGSRIVWWIIGRMIDRIYHYISFQKLILIELFAFPLYYIGVGYIRNPWILGVTFSLMIGWFWGRNELYTDYLIDCIEETRYRATILSIKSQISGIIQILISFGIAGIMGISYQLGFQVLGMVMFVILGGTYWWGIRRISHTSVAKTQTKVY